MFDLYKKSVVIINKQNQEKKQKQQIYLLNYLLMSILSQSKGTSRGPLIAVIKIQLDDENVDRIFLHLKDDDEILAQEFIEKHNLNPILKNHIYQRIQMSRMSVNRQMDVYSDIQNKSYQNSRKSSFVTPIQKRQHSPQDSSGEKQYHNYSNNIHHQLESVGKGQKIQSQKQIQLLNGHLNKKYSENYKKQHSIDINNNQKLQRVNSYHAHSNYQDLISRQNDQQFKQYSKHHKNIDNLQSNKRFNYNIWPAEQQTNKKYQQLNKRYEHLFSNSIDEYANEQQDSNPNIKKSNSYVEKINSKQMFQAPSNINRNKNLYDVSGLKLSSKYARPQTEQNSIKQLPSLNYQHNSYKQDAKIQYTQSQSSQGLFEKQILRQKPHTNLKQIDQIVTYKLPQRNIFHQRNPSYQTNISQQRNIKNQRNNIQQNYKINNQYLKDKKFTDYRVQADQRVNIKKNDYYVQRFEQTAQFQNFSNINKLQPGQKIKNRHSQKQIQEILSNKMSSSKKINENNSINNVIPNKIDLNKYDKFIEKQPSHIHQNYISFQNSSNQILHEINKNNFKLQSKSTNQPIQLIYNNFSKHNQLFSNNCTSNHKINNIDYTKNESNHLSRPKSQRILNRNTYQSAQKRQDLQSTTKFNQQKLFKEIRDFDRRQEMQQNIQLNQQQTNRPSRVKFYNKDEIKSLRQSTMSRSMSKTQISRINKEVTSRLYNQADIKKKYLNSLKARAKNLKEQQELQKQQLTLKPNINILSKILGQKRIKDNQSVEDHLLEQGKLIQIRRQQKVNLQAVKKLSECSFRPQLTQQTYRINAERSRSKTSTYSQMKFSKTTINENTFKPSINKLSNELAKHKGNFQQRQNAFLQQKNSKLFKKLQQKRQKEKIDPLSGQRLFQPQVAQKSLKILKNSQHRTSNTNIHNYLYQLSKVQNPIQQIQRKPTICSQSQKIIQQLHDKRLNWLFLQLDSNQDGLISALKICIDQIPTQILEIIAPVLYEMEELNTELNQEEFKSAIKNLHRSLDPHSKSILYNYNYSTKPIRN